MSTTETEPEIRDRYGSRVTGDDLRLYRWGHDEMAARLRDIAAVKAGTMTLDAAKAALKSRRRAAGLSSSDAAAALLLAYRVDG